MTEPTTEAGRRVWDRAIRTGHLDAEQWAKEILAIEAEARATVPGSLHLDFCGGGGFCVLDDCLCDCHIRSDREALAAEPPALDVERLARAIDETGTVTWDDDPTVLRPKTPTEIATDAAPRYARLAREASDGA